VAPLDSSPALGVFGTGVAGEAFWLGAGVGDPRLSYCCWAKARLLLPNRAVTARIAGYGFIFATFRLLPAHSFSKTTLSTFVSFLACGTLTAHQAEGHRNHDL